VSIRRLADRRILEGPGRSGPQTEGDTTMRFMMLVMANPESEAGAMPDVEAVTAMGKYNDELIKAGVMLAGEGLHPSSKGARLKFDGGKVEVLDGPFAEAKELIGGYWMIQVKSREEAIEWAKRIPYGPGQVAEVQLRQVFDESDFPIELREAAPEVFAAERELRERSKS
jgi:hypothetical protein